MARWSSIRVLTFALWHLLCFLAAASAAQQLPAVRQAVDEIIAACAIVPMNTLRDPLISKLEEFLRRSLEAKSAKSKELSDLFTRLPTDTEKGLEHVTDPRARNFFISTYFNCIQDQTRLKLKSWNITLE